MFMFDPFWVFVCRFCLFCFWPEFVFSSIVVPVLWSSVLFRQLTAPCHRRFVRFGSPAVFFYVFFVLSVFVFGYEIGVVGSGDGSGGEGLSWGDDVADMEVWCCLYGGGIRWCGG
ncbi:hypothetical protein A2U01_0049340, partial [Trifolium medium]|nr:hypothetical protein [Trifolium medium]